MSEKTETPQKIEFKVDLEAIRQSGLYVCAPMYGGQCFGSFSKSLIDLSVMCSKANIRLFCKFQYNESLVQRARNYLTDNFMQQKEYGLMLFIDSDIEFNAIDILVMADLMLKNEQYDVLCATYPKKSISWEKVKQAVDSGKADDNPNDLEKYIGDFVFNPLKAGTFHVYSPVEVAESGTGFMMIKRETFEKVARRFPDKWYRPDHIRQKDFDGSRKIYAYFDCVIDRGDTYDLKENLRKLILSGEEEPAVLKEIQQQIDEIESKASLRYLSEDYYFCQMVRRAGMKVWLAPWIGLKHNGFYTFGGTIPDLAAAGLSVTADEKKIVKR